MRITNKVPGDSPFKPQSVPLFYLAMKDVKLTVQALVRIESEDDIYEGVIQADSIVGCAKMAEELAVDLGCELVRLEFEKL